MVLAVSRRDDRGERESLCFAVFSEQGL